MEYIVDGGARVQRLRHGHWSEAYGGGKCRGHRMTGYCEMTGALISRQCGINHRGEEGPCQVRRTYCPEHGATIWERP